MAKSTTKEALDDFTDQNSKIIEVVVDDNHFMMFYGLINTRPLISNMININHVSLIILDSILLNGLTYLPFVFGGTLKFDASITSTSTYVTNPRVSESVDRQVLSFIYLPFDENSGAPGKLHGIKLAELTEEDLHFIDHNNEDVSRVTNLPFIFGGIQTLDASITPTSCYASILPVSKLANPQVLSMINMPCDTNTGYPIVPIPNANSNGRNYGNGNGDNSRGSTSGNGGSNGRNGGNAANNPIYNWFLPINIHKYEDNHIAGWMYRRKVGDTIPTDIVPIQYHSWESFAGAIYRFSISQIGTDSPIIDNYQVWLARGVDGVLQPALTQINPRQCWPAFEPYFGVFVDDVFYGFSYLVYPWNTVKWLIRDVVVISLITRQIHPPE